MSENKFDLIVIGSGPAGYIGAIKAAQLGFKVACVEKRATLGGTCLNVGCIPSKALLKSSEKYEQAKKHFSEVGINIKNIELDLKKMLSNKDDVVKNLTQGIAGLFKKNKITHITGEASFISKTEITVKNEGKTANYQADKFLIATGSEIAEIPNVKIDEKRIISSTGALELPEIPKHLVVIGGGYIGLELGSVWRRLGAKVTVIEFADSIVPAMDKDLQKELHKLLVKQGMEFKLATKVTSASASKNEVKIELEARDGGKTETITADYVLVSVGRKPNTHNLGLDKLKITQDKHGFIEINNKYQTNIDNIYAVGDVVKGPMLAHKAEEEAVAAAEIMAGQAGHVNYDVIPGVIYTHPEVASVGKTEQELKAAGHAYKAGKFPFLANSRARAVGETDGFVKILADKNTDEVLGVHIIGLDAGTIIHEAVTAMEYKAAAEDIARTCHAHPTLNEAVKEAALAVDKKTLNM